MIASAIACSLAPLPTRRICVIIITPYNNERGLYLNIIEIDNHKYLTKN